MDFNICINQGCKEIIFVRADYDNETRSSGLQRQVVRRKPEVSKANIDSNFRVEVQGMQIKAKTNVSEISSVSIIRFDVVNDRMWLIFIPVCKSGVSSFWCIMK
jgi:hypothetical protein